MKTYVLTGGATGIGAAIKARLKAMGNRVIVVDIKEADIQADLSSLSGRQAVIEAIKASAPEGLDGLVTCAGIAAHVPNRPQIVSVNYFGSVDIVDGVKDLIAKKAGRIVLISSNSAPTCNDQDLFGALLNHNEELARNLADKMDGQQVYAGSKRALILWMRHHVVELAKSGISINAIAPGYTETPMTQAVSQDPKYGEAIRQFLASIPLARAGLPDDMADAVEFLLSEKAGFISGSTLFVDGGHDAMLRPDEL